MPKAYTPLYTSYSIAGREECELNLTLKPPAVTSLAGMTRVYGNIVS